MPTAPTLDHIRDYYEANTSRFTRFGGSPSAGAIHRKLWGQGVASSHEALLYINRLLDDHLRAVRAGGREVQRVLDLGCGIGGTALWLARRSNIEVTGVTISPTQVIEARRRAERAGLQERCTFIEGDFHQLDLPGAWDAAYAIESFSHATSARGFFNSLSPRLKPGARLVLVDDFLADKPTQRDPRRQAWIERFRAGWRLPNLITPAELATAAGESGFQLDAVTDLTPLIRLPGQAGLAALRAAARLPLPGAYWPSLSGGAALQVCLREGWTRYLWIELHRMG